MRAFGHGPLNGEVTFVDPQTIRYEVRDVPPLSYVEGSILFPTDAVPTAVSSAGEPGLRRILEQEAVWAEQANALRARHDGTPVGRHPARRRAARARGPRAARRYPCVPGVPKLLEEPPEEDPVQAAVLWSAWEGHLSPQNAYRAQVLQLARLGAIELLQADGRDRPRGREDRPSAGRDGPADRDRPGLHVAAVRSRRAGAGGDLGQAPEGEEGLVLRVLDLVDGRPHEVRRHGPADPEGRRASRVGARGRDAIGAAGYGVWTAIWGLGGAIGWWLVPVSALSLVAALRMIPARLGLEDRTRVKRLEAFRRCRDFSDLPNAPALAS